MCIRDRDDLGLDPELSDNKGRVSRVHEIDEAISNWSSQLGVDDVLAVLDQAEVPAGKIYNVADIASDPHYIDRGMIEKLTLKDGTQVDVPGIVPKLSRTPGFRPQLAPELGEDTHETLKSIGLSEEQIKALLDKGIISMPTGSQ